MTTRPTVTTGAIGYLEPASGWDAAVVQDRLWEQETLLGYNPDGYSVSSHGCLWLPAYERNWLTNGTFSAWQRGTSFAANPGGVGTADGWAAYNVGVTQETSVVHTGTASLKATVAGTVAALAAEIHQQIFEVTELRGRKVAFSGWLNGAVLVVQVTDGTNSGVATIDASGGWTPFTLYLTVANAATSVYAQVFNAGTGTALTFYIDDFWAGPVDGPIPAVIPPAAVAAMEYRRRYRPITLHARFRALAAGHVEYFTFPFRPMLGSPTSAIAIAGSTPTDYLNVSSLALVTLDTTGLTWSLTATAAGDCYAFRQGVVIDAGVF